MHFQKIFLLARKKFRCIFQKFSLLPLEKNLSSLSKNFSFVSKKIPMHFLKNLSPIFEKSLSDIRQKNSAFVIRNHRQNFLPKIFPRLVKKFRALLQKKIRPEKFFVKKNLASVKERPTSNEVRNPLTLLPNSSPSFSQKKLILSNFM